MCTARRVQGISLRAGPQAARTLARATHCAVSRARPGTSDLQVGARTQTGNAGGMLRAVRSVEGARWKFIPALPHTAPPAGATRGRSILLAKCLAPASPPHSSAPLKRCPWRLSRCGLLRSRQLRQIDGSCGLTEWGGPRSLSRGTSQDGSNSLTLRELRAMPDLAGWTLDRAVGLCADGKFHRRGLGGASDGSRPGPRSPTRTAGAGARPHENILLQDTPACSCNHVDGIEAVASLQCVVAKEAAHFWKDHV